ncbi:HAD family hydrolase [Microvirga rosea]|uniref:HAD family hydrolase n=1 Tax=Microvirga rosea TaxID=2715425 RepID=UPI001D0B0AD6|nr:HAD family hydrolase [Microvirga rosea]MCB8821982.1 haloacid dehalogenase-like hydrolase [Microvirga rosea]
MPIPSTFIPTRRALLVFAAVNMLGLTAPEAQTQTDPLPSWNDGAAKTRIIDFVQRVTRQAGPDFVPIEDRIATFDNDGTLWTEQPNYVQAEFVEARARELANANPELAGRQPFKALLSGDRATLAALGEQGIADLMIATHSGMTTTAFEKSVSDWLATARHPRFNRPYTELIYQPMVELLTYLRANGFKTFIVSGGGVEFMRPWTEKAYGIPPEQVIGSSGKTSYRLEGDTPVIEKLPTVEFVDDGSGKPLGINRFIGRRPVFAAGNSDGDLQMLQWTTLNTGPRFALIVHHTDVEREYAYDRQSQIGRLDKALDEAPKRGWLVVDMKRDWKTIYKP